MKVKKLSRYRLIAMIIKEHFQLIRDKTSLLAIFIIPIAQIILFGCIINTDPKNIPTVVLDHDKNIITNSIIYAMKNTRYFKFIKEVHSEKSAEKYLRTEKALFVLNIPSGFTKQLIRGERPKILLQADATNPFATANAIDAAKKLENFALTNNLNNLKRKNNESLFRILVEPKFNPAEIPQYFSVPGILAQVLTTAMLLMSLIAIAREKETGTMENLLMTKATKLEIILGKITPFIFLAYLQIIFGLLVGKFMFDVPFYGSIAILLLCSLPFILANLAVGLLISTLVNKQAQAIQYATLYILPSMLFSGFIFPFVGLPKWGQVFGNLLPLTHYLRIIKGIMIKGNSLNEVWPSTWPMIVFVIVIITLTSLRYRQTLD